MSCSKSDGKTSPELDFEKFHMLEYAANQWYEHSRLQSGDDVSREVALLECEAARLHWLRIAELRRDELKLRDYGTLPSIYYAVTRCLPRVVEELLEAGQDVNTVGPCDETLLVHATKAEDPDLEVVELLLAHGADVNAISRDHRGESALSYAAARGLPLTKLLVDSGADVNIASGSGTALTAACWKGDLSVAEFLLERGARVNTVDNSRQTALATVSREGHTKIVERLITKSAQVNRMKPAWINSSTTPLRAATWSDHTDVVAMLIDAVADLNAEDGGVLSDALYFGHERTAALLEARGANKLLPELLDVVLI